MSEQLHIARQGLELGCLSEDDARALLKAGFLRPDDLYRTEGMAEWRPLGKLGVAVPTVAGKGAEALRVARQKLTSAATSMGDGAACLSRKLRSITGAGRQQLTESTRRALEDFTPQIRKIIAERIIVATLEAGKKAVHNEAFMRLVFSAAHDCLPRPVRRFVPESVFVQFCMERRAALVGRED